jgi:hypothetical protein
MSKIATYPTLTREECKDAIKAVGAGNKEAGIDPVTVLVMSEPGVGKSAILEDLRKEMGEDEYDFIYVDGPNKDMMDIAATIPNHETKSLEHYVAGLFKMGNGKKKGHHDRRGVEGTEADATDLHSLVSRAYCR